MLHALLISALDGGGWSTSLHLCLMPGSESLYALGGRLCVPQSQPRIRQDENSSVLREDEKAILWLPSSVTIVIELRSK